MFLVCKVLDMGWREGQPRGSSGHWALWPVSGVGSPEGLFSKKARLAQAVVFVHCFPPAGGSLERASIDPQKCWVQVPLGATNLEYDAKGTVTTAEPAGEGDRELQGGRGLLSGESLVCKQIKQEASGWGFYKCWSSWTGFQAISESGQMGRSMDEGPRGWQTHWDHWASFHPSAREEDFS